VVQSFPGTRSSNSKASLPTVDSLIGDATKGQSYQLISRMCPVYLPFYWATVCKTVRPMLIGPLSVLSVCDVGVLWPNDWMDQGATW